MRGSNYGALSSVRFAAGGKMLGTCGNAGISLWNVATWQSIYRLSERFNQVLADSPDGKMLATLDSSGTIWLWDAATGQELRRIQGEVDKNNRGIRPALIFSPDSQTVVSAGNTNTIHLWNAATGEERHQLRGHRRGIYALAFTPDGKTLISASIGKTWRYWDIASAQERRRVEQEGSIRGISPDGRWCAIRDAGNPTLRICDLVSGRVACQLDGVGCNWCAFSPDGKTVAVCASQISSPPDIEETMHLIEVTTGKVRRKLTGHFGIIMGRRFFAGWQDVGLGGHGYDLPDLGRYGTRARPPLSACPAFAGAAE